MEPNRDKAEFNMAVAYLNRLNQLFWIADTASVRLNIYEWFHSLLAIYREISTELTSKEIPLFQQDMLRLSDLVNKKMKQNQSQYVSPDLYLGLQDFELKLRKICKDSGLQMKMQDDAMNSLK